MVDKVFHLKFFSLDLTRFLDEVEGAGGETWLGAGGINKCTLKINREIEREMYYTTSRVKRCTKRVKAKVWDPKLHLGRFNWPLILEKSFSR